MRPGFDKGQNFVLPLLRHSALPIFEHVCDTEKTLIPQRDMTIRGVLTLLLTSTMTLATNAQMK